MFILRKSNDRLKNIGTEFIELLPATSDFKSMKNPTYTQQAINKFKTYKTSLNNINVFKFNDTKKIIKNMLLNIS